MKMHKGIAYFRHYKSACKIADFVGGRVVEYLRGYAVQYRISGPYFPEPTE